MLGDKTKKKTHAEEILYLNVILINFIIYSTKFIMKLS